MQGITCDTNTRRTAKQQNLKPNGKYLKQTGRLRKLRMRKKVKKINWRVNPRKENSLNSKVAAVTAVAAPAAAAPVNC